MEIVTTRWFRAGVGTVIYNDTGRIALLNGQNSRLVSGNCNKEALILAKIPKQHYGESYRRKLDLPRMTLLILICTRTGRFTKTRTVLLIHLDLASDKHTCGIFLNFITSARSILRKPPNMRRLNVTLRHLWMPFRKLIP